jgi:phosphoadenosine phosphosulfate reductase
VARLTVIADGLPLVRYRGIFAGHGRLSVILDERLIMSASPSQPATPADPAPVAASVSQADQAWVASLTAPPVGAGAILALAESTFGVAGALATSFGPEDVVLLHLARTHAPSLQVFTLDTGRLPPETYELIDELQAMLGFTLRTYTPDRGAVEALVSEHGFFSFRKSVEARKTCCGIRKVEPLRRALLGKRAWVTGLRREQSVTRTELRPIEWDAANGLVKFSPLASWSRTDIWEHIREYQLPYNRLHDVGYASIGCAPCSRAIRPYEDERAGRWWWESAEHRECGLHRK